jgi:hypothetical protein
MKDAGFTGIRIDTPDSRLSPAKPPLPPGNLARSAQNIPTL